MKIRLTFFLLLLSTVLFAQDFDRAKMDQYLNTLDKHNKAMFSLAIMNKGDIVYQKSIGNANEEEAIKPNAETQYRIGSITKVFTATIIFQLIEEGKLSLDTKLSTFYPSIKNAEQITISHLLYHQSGIFNITNRLDYKAYMTKAQTKKQMLGRLEKLVSDFEPGSKASYSNSGFILLGYIIEEITGEPYASQLQKRIVQPLGLRRTNYGGALATSENHAKSYRYGKKGWEPSFETHMSIPHGAGAITSTATDLVTFMNALFSQKLINQTSIAKMKEIENGFGRGLFRIPFYNQFGYGHGGKIDEFDANTAFFDNEDVAVAVTANGLNMNLNEVMIGILSIYFNKPFSIPDFDAKPIKLSEKKLSNYLGDFSSEQLPFVITLTQEGGQLVAQAPGQSTIKMTAYSEAEFRYKEAGITVLFEKKGNAVDYNNFALKQGGGIFKFTKK